jgi:osmotically-inducible protein OsmY
VRSRGRDIMKDDLWLKKDLLAELEWEPSVNAADIGVIVKDGVVTLTGYVDSHAEKWAAEKAAKRLSAVKVVANEIEVRLPDNNVRTDEDIARAALLALEWDTFVPHDRIKLTVENGQIVLEGQVEWQWNKKAAENAVSQLMGVKRIINKITVKARVPPGDIQRKIEELFERNAQLDAKKITVSFYEGKVVFRGTVRSLAEREEAERAAWAAGVSEVIIT